MMDDLFTVWKLVLPKFRRSVKGCFALYRSGHVKKTKEIDWEGHNIRIWQRQKSKRPSGMAVGLGIISRYEKAMDQVSEHGQDPCSAQGRILNKYNNSQYGHSNAWLLWQDACWCSLSCLPHQENQSRQKFSWRIHHYYHHHHPKIREHGEMPPAKSRKRNGYGMNTVLQCDVACGLAHDKGFTPEKAQPDSVFGWCVQMRHRGWCVLGCNIWEHRTDAASGHIRVHHTPAPMLWQWQVFCMRKYWMPEKTMDAHRIWGGTLPSNQSTYLCTL